MAFEAAAGEWSKLHPSPARRLAGKRHHTIRRQTMIGSPLNHAGARTQNAAGDELLNSVRRAKSVAAKADPQRDVFTENLTRGKR